MDNDKRKETRRVASHERLSEVLKILRQMLEKYPMLQSNEIVGSAEHLIQQVPSYQPVSILCINNLFFPLQ